MVKRFIIVIGINNIVVYDIFNNGLGNRGREAKMFGIPRYELPYPSQANTNWDRVENRLAPIFREIVMDAVLEQFGRDGYLKVSHNRSSEIISEAVKEGRVQIASL